MPKNPEHEGGPRLITIAQIAEEHGVSRSSVHTYRRSATFPRPVPAEGSTRIRYRADEVAAWFEANPPQQGKRTDLTEKPPGEPDVTQETPTISEATPSNDRGFLLYGGREIPTSYGHTIRVQESSAASGPHAWMFISDSPVTEGHNPHLSLDEAIAVHAALGQFIDGVAERWEDGAEMVADARRRVLGEEGTRE
ncbi:helix-turn-helix domain-containing protein [Streptomyces sp. NBC_00444]|uniref:helix-turn-helix transcriptional regulator n=1 Tax=Streptomyces sp. NBC_00444 TaxID=2975744 RepID=UPI002E2487D3